MNRATRAVASTFGVLAGLPGIIYGFFEILQGDISTNGTIIDAIGSTKMWLGDPAPAFTLVSNYLVTGILAFIISLIVIIWAIAFIQIKKGWAVWICLSILQLLVGGGIAQIMLIPLVGLIASQINAPLKWWRIHFSERLRCILAKQWLWSLSLGAFLYFLHYAIPVIAGLTGSIFSMNNPHLGLIVGYLAIGPFLLSIFAGMSSDSMIQNIVAPK
jgi:hypothetical protein